MYATTMTTLVSILLRLPPDMRERLRAWAEREHRSLNAQIVHILSDALRVAGF